LIPDIADLLLAEAVLQAQTSLNKVLEAAPQIEEVLRSAEMKDAFLP
jgi:hypothetical protein